MIFDSLVNAASYQTLSPRVAAGLGWLQSQFNPGLPIGRYEINGDNVFALVQSYTTVDPAQKRFESHRAYLDIQYVADGNEVIYYSPVRDLPSTTLYDEQKDFQLYGNEVLVVPLYFRPGDFAIFLPQDGHKPGCVHTSIETVKKVVIKARV